MNCPNCGAVVKEGRFCNYCGAKLPDDTIRVEINQKIEDIAEIKRAELEAVDVQLKLEKRQQELKGIKTRRKTLIAMLIATSLVTLIVILFHIRGIFGGIGLICGLVAWVTLIAIVGLLLTGSW